MVIRILCYKAFDILVLRTVDILLQISYHLDRYEWTIVFCLPKFWQHKVHAILIRVFFSVFLFIIKFVIENQLVSLNRNICIYCL